MKRILQIVDSIEYVSTNSFQHQLLAMLRKEVDLKIVTVPELTNVDIDGRTVLSTLKLRSLVKFLPTLRSCLKNVHVFAYEQDVWESFMDEGSYRGSYKEISDSLDVSFLVTSKWWSEIVNSSGCNSTFVKMWILPQYCDDRKFADRSIEVGFMGQLHPFRKKAFDDLSKNGLHVEIFAGNSYARYLENLSNMKFFVHYEEKRWHLNGELIACNGLYGKTVEVMGRGTFCLRERAIESEHWNLKRNPLLLEFDSFDELASKVERIKSLPAEEIDRMIREGTQMIKDDIGWKSVVEAMT